MARLFLRAMSASGCALATLSFSLDCALGQQSLGHEALPDIEIAAASPISRRAPARSEKKAARRRPACCRSSPINSRR